MCKKLTCDKKRLASLVYRSTSTNTSTAKQLYLNCITACTNTVWANTEYYKFSVVIWSTADCTSVKIEVFSALTKLVAVVDDLVSDVVKLGFKSSGRRG